MDIQQGTAIPEVKRTIAVLRELSADEQLRRQAEMREKRIHDEVSALGGAGREGYAEGYAEGMAEVKNILLEQLKMDCREIDLSEEEINELLKNCF